MSDRVLAAIDSSQFSEGVCDYAAWAAQALDAQVAEPDLTGNLGLGTREHLLEKLSAIEEQHAKVSRERGRLLLDAAKERAANAGIADPQCLQRNGTLVETLVENEKDVRLLVVGKRGETAHQASGHLGSNLERVVREMHRPILMVPKEFTQPHNVMMAFDGSKTARKGVEMLAKSPLFEGATCHVVIVGAETAEEHDIDMLVMGAYGHSRIRHLLVGSTTTTMLRNAQLPVLILR